MPLRAELIASTQNQDWDNVDPAKQMARRQQTLCKQLREEHTRVASCLSTTCCGITADVCLNNKQCISVLEDQLPSKQHLLDTACSDNPIQQCLPNTAMPIKQCTPARWATLVYVTLTLPWLSEQTPAFFILDGIDKPGHCPCEQC